MHEWYAAPMEGLTGWRWRQVQHEMFGRAARAGHRGSCGLCLLHTVGAQISVISSFIGEQRAASTKR